MIILSEMLTFKQFLKDILPEIDPEDLHQQWIFYCCAAFQQFFYISVVAFPRLR
jgi:hypothetical protein